MKNNRIAIDNLPSSNKITAQQFRDMVAGKGNGLEKEKRSKFNAQKTIVEGIKFDSKKESSRYLQLMMMHKGKLISKPALQIEFLLTGGIIYKADFVYVDFIEKKIIVEDTKGFKTPEYKLKKKLMKTDYNIEIKES